MTPASPAPRVAAALIDAAVVGVVYALAIVVGALVPEGDIDKPSVLLPRAGIAVGLLALTFLYYFVPEYRTGQTLGKRLVGLRVVMADGSARTKWSIAWRTVFRFVDYQFMGLVGLIFIIATPERQRIGDAMAHTIVVSER
jgi:uncharacterized RDD family membrane protein YckC